MRPPCEIVQREYLPVLRARLAKLMNTRGFSQNEIASRMGITQAAVSKYLRQPRKNSIMNNEIDSLVSYLADEMNNSSSEDTLVKEICSVCMQMRVSSHICEIHQQSYDPLHKQNCQICAGLLSGEEKSITARTAVLIDVERSIDIIESSTSFGTLIPQVRTNLVACHKDAEHKSDVIGIPGRITLVEGYPRALLPPKFGASSHTASLLLWAKHRWNRIVACLCVRGQTDVVTAARENGFTLIELQDSAVQADEIISSANESTGSVSESTASLAIHVPGGHGVEPILYLFDTSAEILSRKCVQLSEAV